MTLGLCPSDCLILDEASCFFDFYLSEVVSPYLPYMEGYSMKEILQA